MVEGDSSEREGGFWVDNWFHKNFLQKQNRWRRNCEFSATSSVMYSDFWLFDSLFKTNLGGILESDHITYW